MKRRKIRALDPNGEPLIAGWLWDGCARVNYYGSAEISVS